MVHSTTRASFPTVITPKTSDLKTAVTNGLNAADLVVTPSAAMMQALNTHYGPLDNARVIPNGHNPENFRSQNGGNERPQRRGSRRHSQRRDDAGAEHALWSTRQRARHSQRS